MDLPTGELLNQPDIVSDGALVGFGFSTDGTRVFVAAANGGVVSTFDFNNQQKMEVVS